MLWITLLVALTLQVDCQSAEGVRKPVHGQSGLAIVYKPQNTQPSPTDVPQGLRFRRSRRSE